MKKNLAIPICIIIASALLAYLMDVVGDIPGSIFWGLGVITTLLAVVVTIEISDGRI